MVEHPIFGWGAKMMLIKGSMLVVAGVLSASVACAAPAAKPTAKHASLVALNDAQMDAVVAGFVPTGIVTAVEHLPALTNPPAFPPGVLNNLLPQDPCVPVLNKLFGVGGGGPG